MKLESSSWGQRAFSLVTIGCIQFVVLTLVAMLFYPGGSITDPTTAGYSFFGNFFSELGLTRTRLGQPNTVSAILFFVALTLAGAGLALFFIAFRPFFTHSRSGRLLSGIGSLFGIISGLCFIGVAFTPANLYPGPHGQFVLWAFQALPIAAILYAIAILRQQGYPKRFAFAFIAFAVLLVVYVVADDERSGDRLTAGGDHSGNRAESHRLRFDHYHIHPVPWCAEIAALAGGG